MATLTVCVTPGILPEEVLAKVTTVLLESIQYGENVFSQMCLDNRGSTQGLIQNFFLGGEGRVCS